MKSAHVFLLCLGVAATSNAALLFASFIVLGLRRFPHFSGMPLELTLGAVAAASGSVISGLMCFPFVLYLLRRKKLASVKLPLFFGVCPIPVFLVFLGFPLLAGIAVPVGLVLVSGVLWRVLPDVYETSGLCYKCGYDLTGNVSGVCPECGQPIQSQSTIDDLQPTIRT